MTRMRGYTLIEVLIVVTILGIAGAIVVPQMLEASSMGVQAAARTLIADLLYAQNEAVIQQRPFTLHVDTDAERYWVESDADGDGTPEPVQLQWRTGSSGQNLVDFLADERFRGVTLAQASKSGTSTTFTEDNGVITFRFNELGEPVQGGNTFIGLIANGGNDRYLVHVADFTGRVTVESVP